MEILNVPLRSSYLLIKHRQKTTLLFRISQGEDVVHPPPSSCMGSNSAAGCLVRSQACRWAREAEAPGCGVRFFICYVVWL